MSELKFHNHSTCDQVAQGQKWFESKRTAEEYIKNNPTATALGFRAFLCHGPGCGGWFAVQAI